MEDYLAWDRKLIWHPFSQHKGQSEPVFIEKAAGAYYYDNNGNKYLDAISSWWVNLHGHGHPHIAQKVSEQFNQVDHIIFDGFTHEKPVELAKRLSNHLPEQLNKFFYSDDGSTANEVAIKMALQFWHNQSKNKTKIIAFNNAYHGDTFGSMSVSGRNVFNNAFSTLLFDVLYIDTPIAGKEEDSIQQLNELIKNSADAVAAFIFEPLIQGAGGMIMYDAEALDKLIAICRKNNILCIADEVMTGFGRTGTFFAIDQLRNKPDIICLSKGITGGVMPLGVTVCSEHIFEAFLSDDKTKTFFHGHSYTANAIACSAACASLDLMEQEDTFVSIKMIAQKHYLCLEKLKQNKNIKQARVTGTILAVELKSNEETHYLNNLREKIYPFFICHGILLRPLGNVIYIMPPYCIKAEELEFIYDALIEFLEF